MTPRRTTAPRRTRPGRSLVAALALGLTVTIVAAACGTDDDAAPGEAAGDTDRVVLVTYDSFALPEDAAAEFAEQTGAEIEVVAAGDSGTMLTRALLAAGAPEGDVIFGIDNTSAGRTLSEELLESFEPDGLDRVPEQYRLDGELGELLTPIDTGDVCMNVDAEWFAAEGRDAPTTLEDLADPAFADLLVVPSPVTSSPGLAFLLGTVDRYGEDGWADYWSRLGDNGVRVRPSWDDAYYTDYTVSGGDRPVVLSYGSSPPAEVIFSEGERTEPASEVMLDSCTSQVEYAGVLAGAAHPELARELVEFMLSDLWQSALPTANFVFPVVDVELPDEFAQWARRAETTPGLTPEQIDEGRDEWIEQWRELME